MPTLRSDFRCVPTLEGRKLKPRKGSHSHTLVKAEPPPPQSTLGPPVSCWNTSRGGEIKSGSLGNLSHPKGLSGAWEGLLVGEGLETLGQ